MFIEEELSESGHWLLAYHRGQFGTWDGSAWVVLDDQDLMSRLFSYFECAVYLADTNDGPVEKPSNPTPAKMKTLVDTAKALTNKGV